MSKKHSDGEIIRQSLILLSPEDRLEVRQTAQKLLLAMHDRNRNKPPYAKAMLGEMMSFELLFALGKFMNEEYPLE